MKKQILRYGFIAGCALISWPLALIAIFATIAMPVLGTAVNAPNATTESDLTGQSVNLKEEIWMLKVLKGTESNVQDCPLSDGFMGEGDFEKAITTITDTEKVAGQVVHITNYGGAGGPGRFGNDVRPGFEQKVQANSFDCQVGRLWFGYSFDALARDQTMLGKSAFSDNLNARVAQSLKQQFAKKRNDDLMRKCIEVSDANSRNNLFTSGGPATRGGIKTAHYVDSASISYCKNGMTSIGALPMGMGPVDSGGSRPNNYTFFTTHSAASRLFAESDYSGALKFAADRGSKNPWFKGNITEIDGVAVYRWNQIDHGNWGPVGSLLAPRMYLGIATTGITFAGTATGANAITSSDQNATAALCPGFAAQTNPTVVAIIDGVSATQSLCGGGSATAAAVFPAPTYTQDFSNAPWRYWSGETIAAVDSASYYGYVMCIHPTNGTWGIFRYRKNNGCVITATHNWKIASGVGTDVTNQTTDWVFPIGSLCIEVDILGTPVGRSIVFGQEALVAGMGTINGSKSNPQFGKRTEIPSGTSHDLLVAIGGEAVWGCAVVKRADNAAPGFAVVNHAVPVSGAPVVS